jgi:hypothetical protein
MWLRPVFPSVAAVVLGSVCIACSGGEREPTSPLAADFDAGSVGAEDAGNWLVDTGARDTATSCVTSVAEAKRPPVDFVFTVDQSSSMDEEIASVRANINKFATYLAATGLDYRVIMIAGHGDAVPEAYRVCVPPPLGGKTCGQGNPPVFRQVDIRVRSWDALKLVLHTYDQTSGPLAWRDVLRADALKIFVPVTDDDSVSRDPDCTEADTHDPARLRCNPTAKQFDARLLAKPGGQFGTATARAYVFYPIVGAAKYPSESTCGSVAVNNGAQYLALAKLTAGKWFPICDKNFAPVFTEIGKDVAARVACEVAIPAPPSGQTIDFDAVNVRVASGSGSVSEVPQDAGKPCSAGANGWQYSEDKKRIVLCGEACADVRADPTAKVSVAFGCETIVR